ncbi:MAG: hypothetical protein ACR2O3_06690 [Rhizobiaceae bacterium]
MNNDRISNTPGGEHMLFGGITFGLALIAYQGLRYELGAFGQYILLGIMAFGAIQLGRGLFEWKYGDRDKFVQSKTGENLLVDIPLKNQELMVLHKIEDALIELIAGSRSVKIELHSVDKANNMGTIHLCGEQADAMFAHVYATLARFALPNGLHLFPKPGAPIDTEIRGKRLLIDLPGTEVVL